MFSQIKNTFKQTAIYSLGNISTKIIGLILLPVYTNPEYLSVNEYGVWTTLDVTSQILIGVLALNLPVAMLRWSSAEKDKEKIKSIIFTTLVSICVIASVSLLFLIPSSRFFSEMIFGSTAYSGYFKLLFLYAAVGIYNGIPLNILRIKEKSVLYVTMTTLKFAVLLSLNVFFVVYRGEGVNGIIKGQLLGELFFSVITIAFVWKSINFKFHGETLAQMLKYGIPLIFSSVSSFILSFGDRYILLHFLDKAKVGIYSLGYKIASVLNMFVLQSFQLGFLPIAYKRLGEKDDTKFFSKILTVYAIVLMFGALSLSLFSREILEMFAKDKQYLTAASVIPLISLAFVFKGIQYNFALSFHYSKKTTYNAAIVVFTAFVSILLNIFLISEFGLAGAAYSMLISVFVMMLLSYYFGMKVYPIEFEKSKLVKIIIAGIVLFSASMFFNGFNFYVRIILKAILLLIYPVALLFMGVVEKNEAEKVKDLFK